jgi:MoaA/NifB/PqqE/SkfB family radical SAM enzyme
MRALYLLWRKFCWFLDALLGRLFFPFRARKIVSRLESSLPGLSVETINICNANCIFCAYQFQKRPRGTMDLDLFRKIIDEYADMGGGSLGLTPTVGEALLDKHLIERIQYARSRPEITSIFMFSNMISLDRVGAENLVHSGISSIIVSVSGLDAAQYKRVYRSDMYSKVITNIGTLIAANKAAGSPVDVSLTMRSDRPLSEVVKSADYIGLAEAMGADKISIKFRYDDWSGRIKPSMLSGGMKIRSLMPARISPCSIMFTGPMIFWDGCVGACGCRDVDADSLIIGDIRKQHLGEIWFGPEIAKLRNEFLTKSIQPICDNCTHYTNLASWARPSYQERFYAIQPCNWEHKRPS